MEGLDESLQEQSCNEDFRVYLEESGVMDVFTHVLVSLVLIKYKSTIFKKKFLILLIHVFEGWLRCK
jgi:hypothetical protein